MAGIGSPVYTCQGGSLFETPCIPLEGRDLHRVARVAHPFERIIVEDPRLTSTILSTVSQDTYTLFSPRGEDSLLFLLLLSRNR